ncbi:CRISPR-associated endonuclease Cas1 [Spirochaetia bacterium 38H-sp]|uniref:CRISPR-associated endonuclease Cas1 n=1 Tax=Rarispira pelagica TaxID=3141764 RepID=A0ABU9U8M8_9SPIR
MGTVYVVSDHGKMVKEDQALCFYSRDGSSRKIFIHRTDRIIIIGSVAITSNALKLIMRHKVDTVFLSKNGRFNGKLEFSDGKNVFLRKKQYDLLENENKKIEIIRSIIRGKIRNQISFMQRINRKNDNVGIERNIREAQKNLSAIEKTSNIDALRGYEGYGSKLFFSSLKENILPEWANFKGRSMHPPKDEVNAVLSFLYTLLLYRIDAAIMIEGLDPYVGYLHTLDYGKRALCFDLIEEYRTSICDTLTCALFNLGILKKSDFIEKDFSSYDDEYPIDSDAREEKIIETEEKIYGIILTKEGLKKVAHQFEEKMHTLIFYPPLNKKISYEKIIIEQIRHFKRVIIGEEAEYKPFVIK